MKFLNKNVKVEFIEMDVNDVNPKIMNIIFKLIEERNLIGKTYVGVSKSWGEISIPISENDLVDGVKYFVFNLNMAKVFLENYRKNYGIDTHTSFDNAVTLTIEKQYDFVTATILFNAKNDYFMVRLCYDKKFEDNIDYTQIRKRLRK